MQHTAKGRPVRQAFYVIGGFLWEGDGASMKLPWKLPPIPSMLPLLIISLPGRQHTYAYMKMVEEVFVDVVKDVEASANCFMQPTLESSTNGMCTYFFGSYIITYMPVRNF